MIDLYILLWLTLERFSFSPKDTEGMSPGCKNLQMSHIMANLSEMFWGGRQWKYELSELYCSLVCRFEKRDWSRTSSIDVGGGKALLVKYNQALSSWKKNSHYIL